MSTDTKDVRELGSTIRCWDTELVPREDKGHGRSIGATSPARVLCRVVFPLPIGAAEGNLCCVSSK